MSHASSARPPDAGALRRDELIRALQARERFLDGILGSLETFMTVDEDWRLTYVNKAAAGMARMQAEDLIGRDMRELMPEVLHGETLEQLQRAMAERVGVEYEVAGPGETTYHGKVSPLADGGLAVYFRDVTEAKASQFERGELFAALELSEQSFAAVFEASPFAMSLTEMPSVRITRVNRAFEDLFGFTREELLGATSPELGITDPASQAEVARRFAADGVVRELEVSRTTHRGERRTLSLSLDWVTVGQRKHVLTSIRDVTKRAQAEEALRASEAALRASEERFRMVLSAAPVTVAAQDEDLRFVWAFNQRTAPEDGVIGKTDADIFTAEEAEHLRGIKRRVLEEGVELHEQLWLDRPRRGRIFLDCTFTPLQDETGRVTGVGVTTVDLTQMRLTEKALRESELAAAAREERSRLARDLHDSVTQALFAANLKAEALTTAGGASPEIDELAQEVRRLTGGALAQMRTMLLELRGEPLVSIPLRQLLRNVVEATESRTRTRVDLTVEGREDAPADLHAALYRITQEALNNVVRHAGAENAWVALSFEPSAVRLTVRDDGCGFDPSPVGPTHLGLRSMRERASEAGADLRVVTAPGSGTEIVVEWRPPAR